MAIFRGTTHITSDQDGNMVVQDGERKARAVVVDGKVFIIRRQANDKI